MGFLSLWRRRPNISFIGSRKLRALQRKIEKYERIFRSSHGYTFVDWDAKSNRVFWDGLFWEELGYSDRDLKQFSTPESVMARVYPGDVPSIKQFSESHIKSNTTGTAAFRLQKKHGGYVWVEVRLRSKRDTSGRVVSTSGVLFDISEQKKIEHALMMSEARHSRILKAASDGIWEWEADRASFHFSSRCWEQLGFDEGDDELTQNSDRLETWRMRIHPEDASIFEKAVTEHFTRQQPFDIEYRIKAKSGEWRWIRARGSMSYTDDGRPWRMSGTNMDITELKLAEERVLKAKEDAENANKAKSQFLSSMSHELRTPLNAIVGFAQLFELDRNLSPIQQENIREIQKAGEHLLGLVNEVLDLSKIESGGENFNPKAISPIRVVEDCLALVQADADARGISLETIADLDEGLSVFADERRLKQVMLNLLSNAVKYNVEAGSVSVRFKMDDSGRVRFTVMDTGKGIPAELRKEVFQPFNRLGAEKSTIEGTGVGLTISKRLVEQMHGEMGFSSLEGRGTTFWFSLPTPSDDVVEEKTQENKVQKEFNTRSKDLALNFSAHKKVLYVEDSSANQRLMQQFLGRYPQIALTLAQDGFSGLYEARTLRPDMIIMDINLPGMDGYETLDILKREPITQDIPVIALSANTTEQDIARAEGAGFLHYLTKPLRIDLLVSVMNAILKD